MLCIVISEYKTLLCTTGVKCYCSTLSLCHQRCNEISCKLILEVLLDHLLLFLESREVVVYKSIFHQLWLFCQLRSVLDWMDLVKLTTHTQVTIRIDCLNIVYIGVPFKSVQKLWFMQDAFPSIIKRLPPELKELHLFPVVFQAQFCIDLEHLKWPRTKLAKEPLGSKTTGEGILPSHYFWGLVGDYITKNLLHYGFMPQKSCPGKLTLFPLYSPLGKCVRLFIQNCLRTITEVLYHWLDLLIT